MNAKICEVTAVRLEPLANSKGRKSKLPTGYQAIRKSYRMLLLDCDKVRVTDEIVKHIPDGWRIESVREDETVTGPTGFVLSVTEKIP